MVTRERITKYIDQEHNRAGFYISSEYSPNLGFKLTNFDSKTNESFSVSSVNEAEDLVISFISTAQKSEIFVNDIYSEDKPLFLRVGIILPEPL